MAKSRFGVIPILCFLVLAAALSAGPAWCVSLQPGWPQSTLNVIRSSAAAADLDGDVALEVIVGCDDGKLYAWHSDGSPVAGWPVAIGAAGWSSPVVGDLDGDGHPEIVIGTLQNAVCALHADGTPVAGWPQATGAPVDGSPALGDLDGDGTLEVVVGCRDNKVYAWHGDGTPLAGWPQTTGGWVGSSPTLADLDGDGLPEVIVGSNDDKVHAWHGDGTPLAGWPKTTGNWVVSSPAVGDLDGDGHPEVVVGAWDDDVYAWHADGSPVAGWPQATHGWVESSPALGDLDGDGRLEVVVASDDGKVYAWNGDGSKVSGWPQSTGSYTHSAPALGDLDGDGRLEIVVGWMNHYVYAWHADGSLVAGWPLVVGDRVSVSPAVADLDGDGDVEVIVGAYDNKMYVWTCGAQTADARPWPMFHHDARHTGVYRNAASAAWLSSGYVTPQSGDTGTRFTWRVKYWNSDDVPPSAVWVATRPATSQTWSWRQMWALDPADALCADGKWYTYSCYLTAGDYAYRFAAQAGGSWAYWPQPAGAYQPGPTVTPANPVALSGGYVTPSSGTGATQFTWRIKYWNTGNAPPDEIKVAIWFPTLKTTYWYSMWAYDPADTNYKDGAWYTFSRRWLPPGTYYYRFAARQGTNWAYWPKPAGSYASGPAVGQ